MDTFERIISGLISEMRAGKTFIDGQADSFWTKDRLDRLDEVRHAALGLAATAEGTIEELGEKGRVG